MPSLGLISNMIKSEMFILPSNTQQLYVSFIKKINAAFGVKVAKRKPLPNPFT